jgi:hypothetical protein
MLGPPVDAPYVYLGTATVAVALLGVSFALPVTPPPDAGRAARAVDAVATRPYNATGEVPLTADAVRLSPERVGLRDDGAAAHAPLDGARITPVREDDRLAAVLAGTPPNRVFDSPAALAGTAAAARERRPDWRPAPDALRVRHVTWQGEDVTLVG